MTRNPCRARFAVTLTDQVRTRPHSLMLAPTTHLTDMDIRVEIEPAFLAQAEVARLLGVPERTLEGWRLTRSGPPWVKLGRHVKHDRDEVFSWAREQRRGQADGCCAGWISACQARAAACCGFRPTATRERLRDDARHARGEVFLTVRVTKGRVLLSEFPDWHSVFNRSLHGPPGENDDEWEAR